MRSSMQRPEEAARALYVCFSISRLNAAKVMNG